MIQAKNMDQNILPKSPFHVFFGGTGGGVAQAAQF